MWCRLRAALVAPAGAPVGGTEQVAEGLLRAGARIVRRLRRAGYGIGPLRALVPELRRAGRWAEIERAPAARDAALTARSRALLRGAAALEAVLTGGRLPPPV